MDSLYATRHGLVRASAGIVSRLSAGVAKTRRNNAPRCRSKEGDGREIFLVGVYRGEPADLSKPDNRSEGLRPPLRAGRRLRLLAAFPDGKVFQKGAHFPENVILPNMLIGKDVGK